MLGGVCGDSSVFGGFDATDADAREHEPQEQPCPVRGVTGEAKVSETKRGDASTRVAPPRSLEWPAATLAIVAAMF